MGYSEEVGVGQGFGVTDTQVLWEQEMGTYKSKT